MTTKPTRTQMLDAINMKVAQVKNSDYGTSYFLPVMIGDVLDYWEHRKVNWICPKCKLKTIQETLRWDSEEGVYRCMNHTTSLWCYRDYDSEFLLEYWGKKRNPLDKQSDDCIQYVYSLI